MTIVSDGPEADRDEHAANINYVRSMQRTYSCTAIASWQGLITHPEKAAGLPRVGRTAPLLEYR